MTGMNTFTTTTTAAAAAADRVEAPSPRRLVPPPPKVSGGPPILPILGRVLILAIVLFSSTFIAATWRTHGINWLYDGIKTPLYTCPPLEDTFNVIGEKAMLDVNTPTCRLDIAYNYESAWKLQHDNMTVPYGTKPEDALERCILPHEDKDYIHCYTTIPCSYTCRTSDTNQLCPDPATIDKDETVMMQNEKCDVWLAGGAWSQRTDCYKLQLNQYCGYTFDFTPGDIIAIRGLIFADCFIVLFWLCAEFTLRRVDKGLKEEQAEGSERMEVELPSKRRLLRQQVLTRWSDDAQRNYYYSSGMSGIVSTVDNSVYSEQLLLNQQQEEGGGGGIVSSTSGDPPPLVESNGMKSRYYSRDPRKRFQSAAWLRSLSQYKQLSSSKRHRFNSRAWTRTITLDAFFYLLITFSQWFIIYFSPHQKTVHPTYTDALVAVIEIWNATSFLEWMIFIDVLLDFCLFLCAVFVVKWPTKPVYAERVKDSLHKLTVHGDSDDAYHRPTRHEDAQVDSSFSSSYSYDGYEYDDDDDISSVDTGSAKFIMDQTMTQDVCLMIACHQSVMTEERYETFTGTLRSALQVFPPSHIFVCDNGRTYTPFDDTQWAAQQVHPDINYLYVPEGNKTFAFYWCNKYWIPYLARQGRVADFRYAVIIDDDVPLPPDLHIPYQMLDQNPNIKAVHFPITAATPDGSMNQLVQCQDIEYKLAGLHKLFQSTLSSSLSCHGAVALWDRQTLDEIFYEHDTVFNGEDMYMGLSLLRRRDSSRIYSCAADVVPTYAPDNWGMLFRQRVKSWDVTSHKKTFTYIWEIINPRSWCHGPSWVLKPYFIQELLTIILDWLRVFLLAGLLVRDWVSLVLMAAVFTLLLYVMVLLFEYIVLRDRRDLRSSPLTIVLFPWYRLSALFFRMGALCQNIFTYSKDRKGIKIRVREDEIRDIPPCPPSPDVDWFTVWTGDDDQQQQQEQGEGW
ncbi:hypothetical protein FOZ62_014381 [Perkinsus olseni]|uniref:Glycosyltransferase 2-like domain-containing protein n=3 Tax=Perkinsus olseni TaxID=32597 RepID=A0A7J6TBK3_PEROL|nr:hypothetical protein FOZ62_014381 [Perkinsus olseni]